MDPSGFSDNVGVLVSVRRHGDVENRKGAAVIRFETVGRILVDACGILSCKDSGDLDVVLHKREREVRRIAAEIKVSAAAQYGVVQSRNVRDVVTEICRNVLYGTDPSIIDPFQDLRMQRHEGSPHCLSYEKVSVLGFKEDAVSFRPAHRERLFNKYVLVFLEAHYRVLIVISVRSGNVDEVNVI